MLEIYYHKIKKLVGFQSDCFIGIWYLDYYLRWHFFLNWQLDKLLFKATKKLKLSFD